MSRKRNSGVIRCPNHEWRLFNRDGVFYACGRKHGNGKSSLGTRDRKTAIEELIRLDAAVAGQLSQDKQPKNEQSPATPEKEKGPIPILDGWDLYISKKSIPINLGGLKPTSIAKYDQHKRRFVSYCSKSNVTDWAVVTQEILEQYAITLHPRLAPITIHDDLTMEISVSNWLIKKKLISADCKIEWELEKPDGVERYCYERDEVTRMLALSSTLTKNRWLNLGIFVLAHTGLRIGEAINLKWSDIDLKHRVLHVRDETFKKVVPGTKRRLVKDKESRIIPIHPALLKRFLECRTKTGYVLTGDQGRQLNYNHSLDAFKRKIIKPLMLEFPTLEDELGFKDGRFHSFRHFFVSECFDAGIPECDIKDWVGHSDSKIVELYRHIRSETAKRNMSLGKFGAA